MHPDKEMEWTDSVETDGADEAWEPTYRDGSVQNECWSEKGYTRGETDDER